MITNKEILFSSLLGSKVAEAIPRLTNVQNELMKHVLPPIPFLPLQGKDVVDKTESSFLTPSQNRERQASTLAFDVREWKADFQKTEDQQFFPVSLSFSPSGQRYLLPYEPFITIKGKNNIVKRQVAKSADLTGTIKERWNRDDFDITITGILYGSTEVGDYSDCFPISDFERLFDFLSSAREIYIWSPPLLLMGITKVVVEDYSFPFTKGENVQAYDIKCVSDDKYSLLVPLKEGEPGVEFIERIPGSVINNTPTQIEG